MVPIFLRNLIIQGKNFKITSKKWQSMSTWNNILKEAEANVGYSTSFLNLRWLLTDEIANLAGHVKKLLGTNHPILKTAKMVFTKADMPSWGLIVLLVAKASGLNRKAREIEKDSAAGILHTQRMVAEVIEILQTGILFHKSLQITNGKEITPEMHQGNKIAILVGDYLITKSYHILAQINDSYVEEIISSALRELCEAEFVGRRNEENEPVPSISYSDDVEAHDIDQFRVGPYNINNYLGKPKSEWTLRNTLGGASLLGKGCLSAMKLGGHCSEIQKDSFSFGVNLALAYQARKDLVSTSENSPHPLSRLSAPVLFQLQCDGTFDWKNIAEKNVKQSLRNSEGVERTREMLDELIQKSLLFLEKIPQSDANESLRKIIQNI